MTKEEIEKIFNKLYDGYEVINKGKITNAIVNLHKAKLKEFLIWLHKEPAFNINEYDIQEILDDWQFYLEN